MPELQRVDMTRLGERRKFILFPHRLYAGDPVWVPPRFAEQMRTVDPDRGEFFLHGEAEFYRVVEGPRIIGTVCAAEDRFKNRESGLADCVFGFLELIDDQSVFDLLMGAVEDFARRRGLERLIGPFDLDYENSYGIAVVGTGRLPTMLCSHNKPWYRGMLEQAGFVPARGRNLAFELPLDSPNAEMEKLFRLGRRLADRGEIRVRPARFADFDGEVERVYYLINKSLAHLDDFKPWNRDDLVKLLREFKSFADPDLILFAELPPGSPLSRNPDNQPLVGGWEPVGFLPGLPNMNELLLHAGGLRFPWHWLRFALRMRTQPECLTIKSVLIPPEYWAKGVSIRLFAELFSKAMAAGYSWGGPVSDQRAQSLYPEPGRKNGGEGLPGVSDLRPPD
jgi:hypothetical protein